MFKKIADIITSWWESISQREKQLVVGAGGAVIAIVVVASVYMISSNLSEKRARIAEKEEKLAEIIKLRGEFRQAESTSRTAEARLKTNTVNLFTLIEDTARRMQVDVSDMNERTTSDKDSKIKEVSVEVTVNKVTQDRLLDFLDKLEHGTELIRITKLRMRTRYDQQKKLMEANVTVSTYKSG